MQVSETDNKDDVHSRATMFEEDVGLDIHSCLQFLIELFERWLTPQAAQNVTINLKREAAKSVLNLSYIAYYRMFTLYLLVFNTCLNIWSSYDVLYILIRFWFCQMYLSIVNTFSGCTIFLWSFINLTLLKMMS